MNGAAITRFHGEAPRKPSLAKRDLPDALRTFYQLHTDLDGDSFEDTRSWCAQYKAAQDAVRLAPCNSHQALLEKLRVFEDVCFQEGGEYRDGRELAWLGSLKADVLALRNKTHQGH